MQRIKLHKTEQTMGLVQSIARTHRTQSMQRNAVYNHRYCGHFYNR